MDKTDKIEITADDFGLLENEHELVHKCVAPIFEIVSNPTILLTDVRARRFNIIDEAQRSASQEIQAQEDEAVFAALNSAAGHYELGAVMAAPIRRSLDYQGIASRIFQVEPMPLGANPVYISTEEMYRKEIQAEWLVDKEIQAEWLVDNDSESDSYQERGRYVRY